MTTLPPLSHHRILELAAPFAARGWQVDLAVSDRAARHIAFRAVAHGADAEMAAHRVALELDAANEARLRVVRRVTLDEAAGGAGSAAGPGVADGAVSAELIAEGPEAGALLDRIAAVPPSRQFLLAGAQRAALAQRLGADGLVLLSAQARVAGLRVVMKLSGVPGFPAELELLRDEGDRRELPEDLLAVLGRRWDRLTPVRRGWIGQVMVRGSEPRRSDAARAALAELLGHLAHTLAEPPARFHERHLGARWRVALRGSGPIVVGAGLVGLALHMQQLGEAYQSLLGLLANLAPPLLMGLFFLRREMPRIGLPRPPRRPRADAWGPAPATPSPR